MASRRLIRLAWAFLAALGLLLIAFPARAQEQPRAGIYIDFGDGHQTVVVVPLDGSEVPSIDLLEASGLPLLTAPFGALGDGVCMIEETGCDLSACRRTMCQQGGSDAPFWQFLQRDPDGNWVTSPLGPSTATVGNGWIDGWFWTGTVPEPPELEIDDLIEQTGYTGGDPAVFSTREASPEDDESPTWIAGIAIIAATAIIGGFLILARRRHAPR